jgi:hypothetical protein
MSQNTDVLREGYEAFGRGDLDAVFANWADDVKWEGGNPDVPAGGEYQGRDEITGAFQELGEAWDDMKVEPDEFVGEGDTVCVLGHVSGTGKATGESSKSPFVHVYRFEGGKVKRIQILGDTLTAARVTGKV